MIASHYFRSLVLFTSYFSIVSCLTFISCTHKISPELKYISFDKVNYSTTIPNEIKIFKSRFELPEKFYEIGAIKFRGEPDMQSILEMAAKHGGMALIKEGNNYVLIRYQKLERRKSNEV